MKMLFHPQRDTTSNPTTIESKETSVTPNQTVNDKLQITTSSAVGSHAAAVTSAAAAKKEEIKILPAVVPVLGYTTTAAPNLYSPIETGVQLFTGAQPTQSTAFPTTYQQGVSFPCFVKLISRNFLTLSYMLLNYSMYYFYFQVGWQHLCDTTANDLRISDCGKFFF